MSLDLTASTAILREETARLGRLLPHRTLRPAQSCVVLRADADGMLLAAADSELTARVRPPATIRTAGEVLVSRRGLTDTLGGIDAADLRLVVEGSRLAIRTPTARFALPLLDASARPSLAPPPPMIGKIDGSALAALSGPVAAAASREAALPILTGVRVRGRGGSLSMLATDRFRLSAGSAPWRPAAPGDDPDALVPAARLAEVARLAGGADEIRVLADRDRFGLAWDGWCVVAAQLGQPYPDRQLESLLEVEPEWVVEVEAGALAGALHRATPYAGPHGRVTLEAGDGELRVRGSDPVAGESDEAVKAAVGPEIAADASLRPGRGARAGRVTRTYQARLLLDALRPFGDRLVRVEIQAGMRATRLRAADGGVDELRCLVVPMRGEPAGD
jgi:DNA polymerase-3 subunit beta